MRKNQYMKTHGTHIDHHPDHTESYWWLNTFFETCPIKLDSSGVQVALGRQMPHQPQRRCGGASLEWLQKS